MLPGGQDLAYRRALAHNPTYETRVEVWRQGERIDPYGAAGLPVLSGGVSATLTSRVTRTLNLTTIPSLYPRTDSSALLSPYTSELRIFRRVRYGAGAGWEFPVFRGRIRRVGLSDALNIEATDRAGDVQDANFVRPETSVVGALVSSEYQRVVTDGVPDATFGTFTAINARVPLLTWALSRSQACDDLAKTVNAFWYAEPDGDFVLNAIPWTVESPPVVALSDGEGGIIIDPTPTVSRDNVFNVVTVTGERADGTTPVYATAQDLNPSSPTYVNGPFGVRSTTVSAQGATTFGQALALAQARLLASKALSETWSMSLIPDPSLELGDTVTISARGLTAVQVLAGFTMPLTPAEEMLTSWRAQTPGAEEEE